MTDELLAQLRAIVERAKAIGDPTLLDAMADVVDAARTPPPSSSAAGLADDPDAWHGILGTSPAMVSLRPAITKYAAVKAPVLITGESGTGKDLVAHALHAIGPRSRRPFVSENCAAIPETLLESVLFGHAKGAFTGAVRDHAGHFVAADKGTLFLDEIGDTPASMQVKLLRALQEGEVRPVGGTKVRNVDVRVVAATNKDLAREVAAGRFREDLYYRLNVLQIALPPLRDRGDDILALARAFLRKATAGHRSLTLGADVEAALLRCAWPGNVRQLQNEMQRVAALADGPVVRASDLSPELLG